MNHAGKKLNIATVQNCDIFNVKYCTSVISNGKLTADSCYNLYITQHWQHDESHSAASQME